MEKRRNIDLEKLPNHIKYLCELCAEGTANLEAFSFFLNNNGNIVMAIKDGSLEVAEIFIDYSWKNGKRIVTLTDQQAILVQDNGFKVISRKGFDV